MLSHATRVLACGCKVTERVSAPPPDVEGEVKDYQEQVKQMLKDLAKEKQKDTEKPLPLMNQVPRTCFTRFLLLSPSYTYGIMEDKALDYAANGV